MSWPSGTTATGVASALGDTAALALAVEVGEVEALGVAVHAATSVSAAAITTAFRRVAEIMDPPVPPYCGCQWLKRDDKATAKTEQRSLVPVTRMQAIRALGRRLAGRGYTPGHEDR